MADTNDELDELESILIGGGGVASFREAIQQSSLKKYVHTPGHYEKEFRQIVEGIIQSDREKVVLQGQIDILDEVHRAGNPHKGFDNPTDTFIDEVTERLQDKLEAQLNKEEA